MAHNPPARFGRYGFQTPINARRIGRQAAATGPGAQPVHRLGRGDGHRNDILCRFHQWDFEQRRQSTTSLDLRAGPVQVLGLGLTGVEFELGDVHPPDCRSALICSPDFGTGRRRPTRLSGHQRGVSFSFPHNVRVPIAPRLATWNQTDFDPVGRVFPEMDALALKVVLARSGYEFDLLLSEAATQRRCGRSWTNSATAGAAMSLL